jgi:hypothetical protein
LRLDRASQRIDDAAELDQEPAPGRLDNAPVVVLDLTVAQFAAGRL